MAELLSTGVDTYCVDELKPGRMARGGQLLAHRLYHRLITTAGQLKGGDEEADFGCDLAGFIGSTDSRDLPSMLPVKVQNELLKDPTVESVKVTAVRTVSGGAVSWALTVKVQSSEGPFELLRSIDDVTVELLGVR